MAIVHPTGEMQLQQGAPMDVPENFAGTSMYCVKGENEKTFVRK
jgi:hypothetical protein